VYCVRDQILYKIVNSLKSEYNGNIANKIVSSLLSTGLRSAYSDQSSQYLVLIFTVLFFRLDFKLASETFLIDYFLVSIIFKKVCELLLKVIKFLS
jgi:hypothetical protein